MVLIFCIYVYATCFEPKKNLFEPKPKWEHVLCRNQNIWTEGVVGPCSEETNLYYSLRKLAMVKCTCMTHQTSHYIVRAFYLSLFVFLVLKIMPKMKARGRWGWCMPFSTHLFATPWFFIFYRPLAFPPPVLMEYPSFVDFSGYL